MRWCYNWNQTEPTVMVYCGARGYKFLIIYSTELDHLEFFLVNFCKYYFTIFVTLSKLSFIFCSKRCPACYSSQPASFFNMTRILVLSPVLLEERGYPLTILKVAGTSKLLRHLRNVKYRGERGDGATYFLLLASRFIVDSVQYVSSENTADRLI